jgi:hypothetical protein
MQAREHTQRLLLSPDMPPQVSVPLGFVPLKPAPHLCTGANVNVQSGG